MEGILLQGPFKELIDSYGAPLIRVAVLVLGAIIFSRIARSFTTAFCARLDKAMRDRGGMAGIEREKRTATLATFLSRSAAIGVWTIAVSMAFREAGFDIAPLLASVGVVGLAVGFGAQSLVRDVIAGLFALVEDQIRVGDIAAINSIGGVVEAINLRTTVLRDLEGVVHIFPNGNITSMSNKTRDYSYYVFDLGVAYKEDTDRVVRIVEEVARELARDEHFRSLIVAPLEVLGVDGFAESAVIIKMRIRTLPGKQYLVGREMNRRIKRRFDELGIEIPFPHRTLYFGQTSTPVKFEFDAAFIERLQEIIRHELGQRERGGLASPSS